MSTEKITTVDWTGLIVGFAIAFFIGEVIKFGSIPSSNKQVAYLLGISFISVIFAIVITVLSARKILLMPSALLGIAVISFLNSAYIYLHARDSGAAPMQAHLYKDTYFIVITVLAMGLYRLIKNILKSLISKS